MKPVDRFGNQIPLKLFAQLKVYGEALESMDWRESSKTPNRFYKDIFGIRTFADLNGTRESSILDDSRIYLWVYKEDNLDWKEKNPDWVLRRALLIARNELQIHDIPLPTRFNFYEECEPGGLFFGTQFQMVPKGLCNLCGEILNKESLFCSEKCEKAYIQLVEMQKEEMEQSKKCALCNKFLTYFPEDTIVHHVSYKPEKTIVVCRSCHSKIHSNHDKYPDLAPNLPTSEKRNEKKQDTLIGLDRYS